MIVAIPLQDYKSDMPCFDSYVRVYAKKRKKVLKYNRKSILFMNIDVCIY